MDTILIIEDNMHVRENVSELLEVAGYKTLIAFNGREGLEMARKCKPDLILCDIMMPELDGYAVLKAFENFPEMSGTPFVFMTAKTEKADFRKGMDLGADDYLTKPFSGDELLHMVSTRLKKSKAALAATDSNGAQATGSTTHEPIVDKQLSIESLIAKRNVKKLKKKHTLFMEGDTCNYLYYVSLGKIKTVKTNEWGKEYITEIYGQSQFFGYTALFTTGIQQTTAIAIENSEIIMIPKEDFFRLIYSDHEVCVQFIRMISNDFEGAEDRLLKMAYDSARKKVAGALLFIYHKYSTGKNEPVTFGFQRENISGLAGISPESVSRNLTDFKEEQLIEIDNGNITITDLHKLESIKQ